MTSTLKLLTADWILPVSAPPQAKSALVLSADKIVKILPQSQIENAYTKQELAQIERIDYGEAILTPGLINLHTHLDVSLRHDLYDLHDDDADHARMFQWMRQLVTGFSDWHPAHWQKSAFQGAAQGALTGTTCFVDSSFTGQSAKQLAKIGLRGIVGLELFGQDETLAQSAWDRWLKKLETACRTDDESFQQSIEKGLIQLTVSPHAPYTVAPALWKLADKWCQDNNRLLLAHLAESREEHEWISHGNQELEDYLHFVREWQAKIGILPYNSVDAPPTPWRKQGKSPCQLLNEHGLLNARLVAAHCVKVDAKDISSLALNQVRVVHCPRSNMFLHNGKMPLRQLIEARVAFGLGTDSLASNADLNMLSEAAFMLELHEPNKANDEGGDHDAQPNSFSRALRSITLDAARVIGLEKKIGSLEPGKLADLAIFQTSEVQGRGIDPEQTLLSTRPSLVALWVNGRQIVSNGQIVTVTSTDAKTDVIASQTRP